MNIAKPQYYAIFKADGSLKLRAKSKRGTGSLYTDKLDAIRQADGEGESVVAMVFDPCIQPVFIRGQTLDSDEE
jgi:hypothetical protein